jgi:hypothetical protein
VKSDRETSTAIGAPLLFERFRLRCEHANGKVIEPSLSFGRNHFLPNVEDEPRPQPARGVHQQDERANTNAQ